jgi:hypothetical protein
LPTSPRPIPPELNGVALTVERTRAHLRQRGHDVELVAPAPAGEAAPDSADELRTRRCPIPMYPDLRLGLAASGALRQRFRRTQAAAVPTRPRARWAGRRLQCARGPGIAR